MLTSYQKVYKHIIGKWLDEYGQALQKFRARERMAGIQRAEENKSMMMLALNTIYK